MLTRDAAGEDDVLVGQFDRTFPVKMASSYGAWVTTYVKGPPDAVQIAEALI